MRILAGVIVGFVALVCLLAVLARARPDDARPTRPPLTATEIARLASVAPVVMNDSRAQVTVVSAMIARGEFEQARMIAARIVAGLHAFDDLRPVPNGLAALQQQFVALRGDAQSGVAIAQLLDGVPALVASRRSDWTAYDADLAAIGGRIDVAPQSVRDALVTRIEQARASIDARRRSIAPRVAASQLQASREAARETAREATEASRAAADLARCGPAPSWEMGITSGVTGYLTRNANDPDSIEVTRCTPPMMGSGDHCWQSTCEFRGRNGFGALVLNARRFDIVNGHVIASASAR